MASRNFGTLTVDLVARVGGFEEGMNKAERATDKLNRQTRKQQNELDRLIGKIDPVAGRLSEIDRMEQQLRKHRKDGLLPEDDFQHYNQQLQQMRQAYGYNDTAMRKNAKSARELAFATRGLPAQFTDIFVSLQAGQNPLTVLLQQGGQIKDMFGGIGPAFKALGGYALGLVNPFTLGAASIGALGVAAFQGADEADEFSKTLALTGNTAGVTADQLSDLSQEMDSLAGVTRGQAADALNEVAKSGKFTADQFRLVTAAALSMQNATGKAISDTVDEFAKISGDPVKAIRELNDQYHFLTASVYENINSLVESGNTTDAVRLAMETYADTAESRAQDVVRELGYIETIWKNIKNAAREGWDAIAGVGRADTLSQQIANVDSQLEQLRNQESQGRFSNVGGSARNEVAQRALIQQRAALVAQRDLEQSITQEKANQQKIQDDGIAAQVRVNELAKKQRSNAELAAAAYAQLEKDIQAAAEAGSPLSDQTIADARAAIKEQYKDTESLTSSRRKATEAEREAAKQARDHARAIAEQEKAYQALIDRLDPVSASYRSFAEDQNTLNAEYERGKITLTEYLDLLDRLKESQESNQTASQAYSGGFGSEIGSRGGVGAPTDPLASQQGDWDRWLESAQNAFTDFDNLNQQAAESFTQGFGDAIEGMVFDFESFGDAARSVFENIGRTVVNTLAQMGAQWVAYQAIQLATGQSTQAAATAGAAATGSAMAAAYAPAAALASLASFGSNSIPASAALTSTTALATSLAASSGFAGLFDRGGDIRSGQWGIVGERGPEIVQGPANVTSRVDTARLMSSARSGSSSQQSGNGNHVNVSINNYTDSRVSTRSDGQGGLTIDIVKAELARDFRTNGQVSQAGQQNFQWQRKGR